MRAFPLALTLLLGGCAGLPLEAINDRLAGFGDRYRDTFAVAYDRGKALLCLDMPLAVIQRKNPTPERMLAFGEFCNEPVVSLPPPTPVIVTVP